MTEKADLLDQIQHYEHVNVQLENETETIGKIVAGYISSQLLLQSVGEYIILYQQQRESLKKKFEQKDCFITQLIGEKETLQVCLQMILYCHYCTGLCHLLRAL